MNKQKVILLLSRVFMCLSAFSLLVVSMMAFASPQSVMDLVHVQLGNTDTVSSIRGVYGGVGLSLVISIIYMWNEVKAALIFLSIFWGLYTLSRLVTIYIDGDPGAFGSQWMRIESTFFVLSLVLSILYRPRPQLVSQRR